MPNDERRVIYRRTPESAAMVANVKRAMSLTAKLNRLSYDDADAIRTECYHHIKVTLVLDAAFNAGLFDCLPMKPSTYHRVSRTPP
jgi:DNA-binding MarR family transcriptional regulator